MVGSDGTVYAVDVHPLALGAVKKKAAKERLNNVKPIHSGLHEPDFLRNLSM